MNLDICQSKADYNGWASFFGSYLGGVIGGCATLAAVIITIADNQKTRDEKAA